MEVSDTHGVYNSLKLVKINFEEFDKLGFKEVMMNIVMLGGEAACNGLVAGAIFGALAGFQSLPSQWILNINIFIVRVICGFISNMSIGYY